EEWLEAGFQKHTDIPKALSNVILERQFGLALLQLNQAPVVLESDSGSWLGVGHPGQESVLVHGEGRSIQPETLAEMALIPSVGKNPLDVYRFVNRDLRLNVVENGGIDEHSLERGLHFLTNSLRTRTAFD